MLAATSTHSASLLIIVVIIGVALFFDYSNGFHDAANSIATVVSTRVLTPRIAVLWAAAFNFIAFLIFGTKVANTVGKTVTLDALPGTVQPEVVVFAGLAGAIIWNLLTWWLGLPTSSSHALIGGFAGAGVSAALGFHNAAGDQILNAESIRKTAMFIVISPTVGFIIAFIFMLSMLWLFQRSNPGTVDRGFRKLQLISAAAYSLGHGGNDAQKTMGIITALLVGTGYLHAPAGKDLPIELWIVLSAHTAIALGTLSGGWRIVKTLGSKITKLKPVGGFSAETAAATALFGATHFGIPVSTTHTITGAIVGVGSTQRLSAVRWGIAGRIVWAWLLTIPAAASIAFATYRILDIFT